MLKVRFIILAILLGLRLYGANSNFIKAATTIGLTITAFTILFTLIRGRSKRHMGGNYAFMGIIFAITAVGFISAFLLRRPEGLNFYMLPIVFIGLGVFALGLFLMRQRSKLSSFMGGMLGGGAVSLVVLAFITFMAISAMNNFATPIENTYNVALTSDLPFVWAK